MEFGAHIFGVGALADPLTLAEVAPEIMAPYQRSG
jgi:hypothetical protein